MAAKFCAATPCSNPAAAPMASASFPLWNILVAIVPIAAPAKISLATGIADIVADIPVTAVPVS